MAGTEGINAELLRRFGQLQAAAQAAGTSIGIGSGYRTVEQQAALRVQNGCPDVWHAPARDCDTPTAIPGTSNHNHGLAIDITGDKEWANANASRFGLHFPVEGENWHIEMIGSHGGKSADPHIEAAMDQGAIGFDLKWATNPGELQDQQDSVIKSYVDAMVSAHNDALELGTPADAMPILGTPDVEASVGSPVEGAPTPVRQDVQTIPGEPTPGTGAQQFQGEAAAGDRLGNARIIAQVGRSMGAPPGAIQIALAAALAESNLINVNYGDRDSLGLFQQRPSQGWGSPQQVMNPTYAAQQFFSRLLDSDWQNMTPGQAAQSVQRSAFPSRYGERFSEAVSIYNQLG